MSSSGNPDGRPSTPVLGRTAWARSLETPLREFLRTETGGAAVLLATAVAALVWVNADASSYESLWGTTLSIDLGDAGVALDLRHWVNSGLMTFFFFVVGLEARREFDLGELRERRRFALPLLAAIGGMAVAVAIYLAFNAGRSSAHGWGIAMSTDTAFALGLLALVGPRFPPVCGRSCSRLSSSTTSSRLLSLRPSTRRRFGLRHSLRPWPSSQPSSSSASSPCASSVSPTSYLGSASGWGCSSRAWSRSSSAW